MNDLEFVSYTPTRAEKNLGIATIRYGGIYLRFRVSPGKDGRGFFCSPPAIKSIHDSLTGKDRYEDAWMVDSRYENDRIKDFARANVEAALKGSSISHGIGPRIAQNTKDNQIHQRTSSNQPAQKEGPSYQPSSYDFGEAPF